MSDENRIDSHKLMYHPGRVAQWHQAGDDWEKAKKVCPIYVEVSPTGSCNHRCEFCAMDYVGYKPRSLSMDIMEKVLPEMGQLGIKSIMFAGEGEPLLYTDINRLAKKTVEAGIDIAFTTNGVLLRQKTIENLLPITAWIKVSIDAGTSKTYADIHNTKESDFNKVIKNLKNAVSYKKSNNSLCSIGAQILLLPENFQEIDTLARLCRDDIGLDYLVIKPYSQHMFSITRRYCSLNYELLSEQAIHATRLSNDNFEVIYRSEATNNHDSGQNSFSECNAVPFFWAHIMANHDVYACSAFLQDERFALGNLMQNSFREIWEGEKRKRLFKTMRTAFNVNECRINCRMSCINRYLWDFKFPHPHVNFI